MSRWILLALAACGAPPAPAAKPVPLPPSMFSIGVDRIGPIDEYTPANLTALRELVGKDGYTVRPINDGGVELHVYDGAEHLLYVIPNDDGSLFNVHVVSASVVITQHPEWVITKPFSNSDLLTHCECWGARPVCWREGDHVALGFARDCDDLSTPKGREALVGTPIQRAVWSPKVFGEIEDDGSSAEVPEWIPRQDSP